MITFDPRTACKILYNFHNPLGLYIKLWHVLGSRTVHAMCFFSPVTFKCASSKEIVLSVPTWFREDPDTNGETVTGQPYHLIAQLAECSHNMQKVPVRPYAVSSPVTCMLYNKSGNQWNRQGGYLVIIMGWFGLFLHKNMLWILIRIALA